MASEDQPSGRPLLVVVSRLVAQKGLPLMLAGLKHAVKCGAQVRSRALSPRARVHRACPQGLAA